ncbi:MAG: septum formation protein Maf [Deltaproteobacteria bacterium]|nr:MAG: septum formation protein Maf [Deltaproteobacteria bacterium]
MFSCEGGGPFRVGKALVLASASPRRQALLSSLGIYFEVMPAKGKEPLPDEGEAPAAYAQRMAVLKAQGIANKRPDAIVIGADTIVVQGTTILGKPRSKDHALAMLMDLCGTTHEVITGYSLIHKQGKRRIQASVSTLVEMPAQRRDILAAYVATGEPLDKAGSYAIQGAGGFLVRAIQGSYTNVVGLPLTEILNVLLDWEAIHPDTSEKVS